MKRFLLYILLLLSCTQLHAQTVTNVDARQDGQNIVITFNMDKPCIPTIMYSITGKSGNYVPIPEQYLQKTTMPGTAYKYTWKVLEQFDEFSFDNVVFKIETSGNNAINGALSGVFSVSPTKKIQFSQGNLQYQASTNTWRFAEHQYNVIGEENKNISSTYSGWIDLFGWGTSGYNGKKPYMTSTDYSDYGNGTSDIAGTKYDWGVYNKISNIRNQAIMWRTLTIKEWNYLRHGRIDADALYGTAMVNGINGCIFLPDDWTLPTGITFISGANGYSLNTYTTADWSKMEANGAVFLPAAGFRYGTDVVGNVGSYGYYWSSSAYDYSCARCLFFYSGDVDTYVNLCNYGRSVRLVKDVN